MIPVLIAVGVAAATYILTKNGTVDGILAKVPIGGKKPPAAGATDGAAGGFAPGTQIFGK